MKSLGEIISSHGLGGKTIEACQDELVSRDRILTPLFGWVSKNEADWLNKQIRSLGYEKDITELAASPAYIHRLEKPDKYDRTEITVIEPFIDKFWEMRKARELKDEGYLSALEILG